MPKMPIEIIKPSATLQTPPEQLATYPKLIERAARTCYQSFEHTSDESHLRLIKHCLDNHHDSVIEHCVVSFSIVCSRAASHQLVRHRIASYAQESQRYVDYQKKSYQVICPPSVLSETQRAFFELACQNAFSMYESLRDSGVLPEDARFVLPNACKTEIFTTMNLRSWRHFLRLRALNPHAQWEIRAIARSILATLQEHLPVVFEDLK